MNHFFITPKQIKNKEIIVTGDDVRHIKNILRMKKNDEATFSDGENPLEYHGIISDFSGDAVRFALTHIHEVNHELPAKIYLFQALPKADKMELIIQKAVELGIYEIIPISTVRTIIRLDEKKAENKLRRWQNINIAAAKQCKRQIIPAIRDVMSFTEAVGIAATMDIKLIPYEMAEKMENTKKSIESIKSGQTVAIFIGPEGGFTNQEIEIATKANIIPVTLGKRILRTETAAFVILSWIMYHLEEKA